MLSNPSEMNLINNNGDNSNIEETHFQYNGKYGIKELFLKRIKMDPIKTKIESLNDLSNLMIAYARNVPYHNSDLLFSKIKNINVEYSIQRVLIENKGTNCICLNLLFGTFLFEMGIDVKLVSSVIGSKEINNPWFQYHMANIILWNDGKLYFIDCGLCAITPYKPIELGNSQLIYNDKSSNRGFKVRHLSSNTPNEYVYEYIQNGKTTKNIVFHFTLDPVNLKSFDYCITGYPNGGINNLIVYKLFKHGHYYLFNNIFIIQFNQFLDKCKNNCCISDNYCLNETYPVFPHVSSTKTKIIDSNHFKDIYIGITDVSDIKTTFYKKYPDSTLSGQCSFEFTLFAVDNSGLDLPILNVINGISGVSELIMSDTVSSFYEIKFNGVNYGDYNVTVDFYLQNDPSIKKSKSISFICEEINVNSLSFQVVGTMDLYKSQYTATIKIDNLLNKNPFTWESIGGYIYGPIASNHYLIIFQNIVDFHLLGKDNKSFWNVYVNFTNSKSSQIQVPVLYPNLETTINQVDLSFKTYPTNIMSGLNQMGKDYTGLITFNANYTYLKSIGFNYPMNIMFSNQSEISNPRVTQYDINTDTLSFIVGLKNTIKPQSQISKHKLYSQKQSLDQTIFEYSFNLNTSFFSSISPIFFLATGSSVSDFPVINKDLSSFTISIDYVKGYDFNNLVYKYKNSNEFAKWPFSFISGNNYDYDLGFTSLIRYGGSVSTSRTNDFTIQVDGDLSNVAFAILENSILPDIPPILSDFKLIQIDSFTYLVHLSIQDGYGVDTIYLSSFDGSVKYSGISTLIDGYTLNNGIFQMVYNVLNFQEDSLFVVKIVNTAGSFVEYKRSDHYKFNTPLETISLPNSFTDDLLFDPFSISSVTYSNNNVDVRDRSIAIKMTFKFTTFNQTKLEELPPMGLQLVDQSTVSYADKCNYKFYPIRWNDVEKVFMVEFKLRANRLPGIVPWEISINSNNKSIKNTILSQQDQLVVSLSNVDVQGPIFIVINKEQLASGFGWLITISDEINGFSYGNIVVVGEMDNSIYNFSITPNQVISGNSKIGIYRIEITISSMVNYCKTQNYIITNVDLFDTQGNPSHFAKVENSNLNQYKLQVDETLNPFINYLDDSTINTIYYQCSDLQSDITPPILSLFQVSNNVYDTGTSTGPGLTISFASSDPESGLKGNSSQQPKVYLINTNFDIVEFESTLTAIDAHNASYQLIIPHDKIPFGFGYPTGFLLSVYGFINNNGLYSGYSSQMLNDLGYQSFISTKTISLNYPIIQSTSDITIQGGNLFIYGRSLSSFDHALIKYQDGQPNQMVVPYTKTNVYALLKGVSATLLPFTIETVQTNSNVFKVTPIDNGLYIIDPSTTSSSSFSSSTSSSSHSSFSSSSSSSSSQLSSSSSSTSSSSLSSSSLSTTSSSGKTLTTSSSSSTSSSSHSTTSSTGLTLTTSSTSSSSSTTSSTTNGNKCPGEPSCGGPSKGICVKSNCICFSPWIGLDCQSHVIIIPNPLPINNGTKPSTEIEIPTNNNSNGNNIDDQIITKSIISIVSLRELNFNQVVLKNFTFDKWIFNQINENKNEYFTNVSTTNGISNELITTTIKVTLDWFNSTSVVEFANQNLTMNPSTIKYTIEISKYPFSNVLNQLQLVIAASIITNEQDVCSKNEYGNTNTDDDSNYMKLQVNYHSVYGRFLKHAVVDNQSISIENINLPNQNELSNSYQSSLIAITLPNYKNTAVIDPDFSVLLDDNSVKYGDENSVCNPKSNKLTPAQISGIVIGSVAFATVAVSSVVYTIYKKKQHTKFIHRIGQKLKSFK